MANGKNKRGKNPLGVFNLDKKSLMPSKEGLMTAANKAKIAMWPTM
jgi:hypothetical protein